MAYQIKHWNETFENNKSREIKEPKYVAWPVRRDSEGFQHLSRLPNFLQAFGLFALLVQLAARQNPRGVLRDDRGDITPERIAKRYGVPPDEVKAAFDALSDEDVGWVVPIDGMKQAPSADVSTPSAHTRAQHAALSSSPSVPSDSFLPDIKGVSYEPEVRAIPDSVLFREVLKHYPLQQAIRGAYHVTSEAVYRLAHARHGGDLEAALAWLGDRVRAFAKAKQGAEKRYIPQARNWMERGSYDDDPATWAGEAKPKTAAEMIDEAEEKERKRKAAKGLV